MISSENQLTCFCMVGTSVMKELIHYCDDNHNIKVYSLFRKLATARQKVLPVSS